MCCQCGWCHWLRPVLRRELAVVNGCFINGPFLRHLWWAWVWASPFSPACGPPPYLWVTTGLALSISLRVSVRAFGSVLAGDAAAGRIADSTFVDEEAPVFVIRLRFKKRSGTRGIRPRFLSACLRW